MYLYPCAVYRAVYIIYVVFSFNMSLSPLEIVIAPNNVSSVSRDDASRIQA